MGCQNVKFIRWRWNLIRKKTGKHAYLDGLAAKQQVAAHYQKRGYQLKHTRWRGAGGEIDLILFHSEVWVFVEVKRARGHASAASRLSRRQIQRMFQTAEEFCQTFAQGQLCDMRFDLALVNAEADVEILENALYSD